VKAKAPMTEFLDTIKMTLAEIDARQNDNDKPLKISLRHMRDILERWRIAGMNRKLQLKPKKWEEYVDDEGNKKTRCTSLQMIFKYGGNLTRLGMLCMNDFVGVLVDLSDVRRFLVAVGENQALRLGRRVRRDAYPDVSELAPTGWSEMLSGNFSFIHTNLLSFHCFWVHRFQVRLFLYDAGLCILQRYQRCFLRGWNLATAQHIQARSENQN
jgi:hypothetical protein